MKNYIVENEPNSFIDFTFICLMNGHLIFNKESIIYRIIVHNIELSGK